MTASVPNQFAGTATSDVSALDANFAALVNYLNSTLPSYVQAAQGYSLGFGETGVVMAVPADLNVAPLGWVQYNPSTSNLPGTSNYGICLTVSHVGTLASTSAFVFQTARTTDGQVYTRQNISAAGWTAWESVVQAALSLPDSVDLDTVLTSGFYRINATPVNGPPVTVDNSQLLVSRGSDTIFQLIVMYGSGRTWTRGASLTGGTQVWSAWIKSANALGDSTQTFAVATAVAATEAVPLAQAQALYFSTTTNVTASRVLGTFYTNTDSTARFVTFTVWGNATTAIEFSAEVDAITVYSPLIPAGSHSAVFSFVVPPGITYQIVQSVTGAYTNLVWTESR